MSFARAPSVDAILNLAFEEESDTLEASMLAKLAWLYELEQIDAKAQPWKEGESVVEAVDKLLATYWP